MNTYEFKKLQVWQKAMALVTEIYRLTTKFPTDERFGLSDQLGRATISIALNMAEGCGTGSEMCRFYILAGGEVFSGKMNYPAAELRGILLVKFFRLFILAVNCEVFSGKIKPKMLTTPLVISILHHLDGRAKLPCSLKFISTGN